MRPLTFILIVACIGVSGTAVGDGDAKNCDQLPTDSPLTTETATAGYLANFTNRDGSIRSVSKNMLTGAIESARSDEPVRRIIFRSIPQLSTKTDADDQMCERYEKETTKEPLRFDDKRFATVDDLTDWIMHFTQGKGKEGRWLYEQCPGKCSPQYTWWIDPEKSDLLVRARVVCGRPRDHDSDKYQLSIDLVPLCPAAESQ
jgi:hypothetical protein